MLRLYCLCFLCFLLLPFSFWWHCFLPLVKPRENLHQEWAREVDHMQRAVRLTDGINWNLWQGQENKKRRSLKITVFAIIFHPATSEATYSDSADRAYFFCFVWRPAWHFGTQVPSSQSAWAQLRVSHSSASCPDGNWKKMERDGGSVRVVWATQRTRSSRGCPLGH